MVHLWVVVTSRNLLQRGWNALRDRELSVSYWQDVARRMTELVKARQSTAEELRRELRRRNESFFEYDMWSENGFGPDLLGGK